MKFNDTQQLCPGNPERSTHYQQNLQKSRKRRRVERGSKNGKVSVHDPDNVTSIQTHEGTFTQSPVDYPKVHVRFVPSFVGIPYDFEVEVEVENEAEQGCAETFREEGAQS